MENTLKQKLAAGAQPIGTFFDTASVSLMECLGRTWLDFAIIDNEHSPIEAETTAALVRAAELSGICPLARVREISRPAVLKLLDVGVQGLIVPNVKTLEQVQELVNYAKYYPIGQRGFCPSRKDGWGFDGLGSVPETMRHFNGETLLFPQCETAEALDIIEDICAVDGVDGIFVGPFDLSISMGMPGQFDAPEFQAARALAISAMVLPGISGSSLLMSCGLCLPVIAAMKDLLRFQFGQFWLLAAVGLGVLAGFAIAPHCIRGWMRKAPGAVTYAVLGMMLGSLYAIVVGPTTLKVPQHAMTISDFHLLWFALGITVMLGLEALKRRAQKAPAH